MANPTQDTRTGRLATPLGKDKLLLGRFDGAEGMGELFEYRIEALSLDADINFDNALGLNSSVHLETTDGAGRDFSGVMTEARWLSRRGDYCVYSLVLRPWLWLLSLTSDCRIFPNMNARDIIKKVFEDRHFSDVIDLTAGDYPTLEYTVQYRETDLNFVLRLMEEYGIYYYFQFMPGDGSSPSIHYLVLADSTTHVSLPNPTEILYLPVKVEQRRDIQQFNDWTKNRAMVSGVYALTDYDYKNPGASLAVSEKFDYKFAHGDMEIYNYPGDYDKENQGKKLAQVSRDAARTRNLRCTASGYAPSLTPGFTIKRTSTESADTEVGDYLLLRCVHSYGYQDYESTGSDTSGATYYGTYELAKSDIPYRMPQQTRKPVIVGAQSALVVGEKGEEIDVDKQGRICVQFYWNRDKSYNGQKKPPSRQVRIGQFWAGSHRGALFVPRIGDEVMIQYEEGDPDRPIVVGSVYNGTNTVPMDLPAKKNNSGILTKSTKNSDGYNMLLFNDTAGSETIKLRAQKDLMFKALNDEKRVILGNQTEQVGGDETITVGDMTIGAKSPGGNFTLNALKTATINVGPVNAPWTQILMDTSSITLNVGPSGLMAQIVMTMTGITLNVGPFGLLAKIEMGPTGIIMSGTPISQVMIQPMGVTVTTPMVNMTAMAAVNVAAPVTNIAPIVNVGVLNALSGTVGGVLPLL